MWYILSPNCCQKHHKQKEDVSILALFHLNLAESNFNPLFLVSYSINYELVEAVLVPTVIVSPCKSSDGSFSDFSQGGAWIPHQEG